MNFDYPVLFDSIDSSTSGESITANTDRYEEEVSTTTNSSNSSNIVSGIITSIGKNIKKIGVEGEDISESMLIIICTGSVVLALILFVGLIYMTNIERKHFIDIKTASQLVEVKPIQDTNDSNTTTNTQ